MASFRTITDVSQGVYKEKGSRFLAYALPVTNLEQVRTNLDNLKKEHHKARHHCYAYRLGASGDEYRAHDDGEPKHSAGDPILGQIMSFDLTNLLIVVVRYFGGTKLGISGLINAYREAAKQALQAAEIVQKENSTYFLLFFDYPDTNRVTQLVKEVDLTIVNQKFEASCEIVIKVPESKTAQVIHRLAKVPSIKFEKLEDSQLNST